MHSTNINTVIGTQKCVYTHSCLGNLDRTQIGEIMRFVPLQDRFYSNRRYNYYWINTTDINDFEKSGQIRLDERQFKLLKRWFKKERVKR